MVDSGSRDSIPQLELQNVRTREDLRHTVNEVVRRSDVPAQWRLAVAKARQQLHRDPTPLVAMAVTAGAGLVAIVGGVVIGRTDAGRLDAAREPMLLPVYKPGKTKKSGKRKKAAFARKPDKLNPVQKRRDADDR
ncbi:hypothetical protein [Curtobacterium sp. MCBD17_028]|uniref:hypothetical protein n=1 Tax=Curtobacterium sp. MCBD17_028 TaxID=2175670 RepID=UPI000DAA6BFC|nr:hypothetical protein [Curtobacterium sp. MCBD17_028]PZE27977.1 hypothetical protein DEI86_05125 [Curtobacterium sp. MCBD17_028]